MSELFESFPCLKSEMIIIRKMTEDNLDDLSQITENDNVYRYIPPFLYKKSRGNLLAAIKNLGGRDFDKKKMIIAGIYLSKDPDRLIGLAEMFDYKKRANQITIGYRLNETYWHRGITTEATRLMINYLSRDMKVKTLKAYVMPENIYSQKVLLRNGFTEENDTIQGNGWGGKEISELKEFTYTAL